MSGILNKNLTYNGRHFYITRIISLRLSINFATLDESSSLLTASYEMVFYLKIHHTKSVMSIHGYCCSKCGLYEDIRGRRFNPIKVETHVWKLTFAWRYTQHTNHVCDDNRRVTYETRRRTPNDTVCLL